MKIHKNLNLNFFSAKKTPIVLQTEAAECGLACMSMVAGYWGKKIDLPTLRKKFSVSLKGLNLQNVINLASGLQLQTRALKADLDQLHALKLPCILHWNFNHFVVLVKVSKFGALIHDPAVGKRKISTETLNKYYTGVALEIYPAVDFTSKIEIKKTKIFDVLGKIYGLSSLLWKLLILGFALQVFSLLAPFYTQWLVDDALTSSNRSLVSVLGSGFLLLAIIHTVISAVRSWLISVMAININFQWFNNTFTHLLKLPISYFEKRHTGDIVSRFNSIQTIQRNLTAQFVEGVIDGFLALATLSLMFFYSIKLAILSIVAVLIYVILRVTAFKMLNDATSEQIIHAAKQNTYFIESIRGIQSVRLFNASDQRRQGWLSILSDQFNAEAKIAKISVSFIAANNLIFNGKRVILVWLAGLSVLDNVFTIGMLIAFLSYQDQFAQRIGNLIDKLFEFRMLRLHADRVADITQTETEGDFLEKEICMDDFIPSIELKNVGFRYSESEDYVLKNVNLFIPARQFIAVIGPSGCGKSTLMKIILGLLEPTEGEILIGGTNLKNLGKSNYRKIVGTVMQDDTLFSGSIFDNISFFSPDADFEKVIESAKDAAIHQEIRKMPMGYHTLIGDIGTGVSGGQKQRMLLARALYRQPKILVLDEATSHLDVANETAVNSSVKKFNLTRLIVAHRPNTIASADRVVVLSRNGIIQDSMFEGELPHS